jgi:hypothetical protein
LQRQNSQNGQNVLAKFRELFHFEETTSKKILSEPGLWPLFWPLQQITASHPKNALKEDSGDNYT